MTPPKNFARHELSDARDDRFGGFPYALALGGYSGTEISVAMYLHAMGRHGDLCRWDLAATIGEALRLAITVDRKGRRRCRSVEKALSRLHGDGWIFIEKARRFGKLLAHYWLSWRADSRPGQAVESPPQERPAAGEISCPMPADRPPQPLTKPRVSAQIAPKCRQDFSPPPIELSSNTEEQSVQVPAPDVCSVPDQSSPVPLETPTPAAAPSPEVRVLMGVYGSLDEPDREAIRAEVIAALPPDKKRLRFEITEGICRTIISRFGHLVPAPEPPRPTPARAAVATPAAPTGPPTPALLEAIEGIDESNQRRALPHVYGRFGRDPASAAAAGRARAVLKTLIGDEHSPWLHRKLTDALISGQIPGDKGANLIRDTLALIVGGGPDRPDPIAARVYFGKACAALFEDFGVPLAKAGYEGSGRANRQVLRPLPLCNTQGSPPLGPEG